MHPPARELGLPLLVQKKVVHLEVVGMVGAGMVGAGSEPDGSIKASIPFAATPGPLDAATELESDEPADFLQLFITNELLQHIADATNQFADNYFESNPSARKKLC
ncbi:uncharacterized protein LOC144037930 [Vanacampus margaritifer]